MLFNSISYLVFFPTVFFLYWTLPAKMRTLLLLIAGAYFYMAFVPYYILILVYLITIDYFLARFMEREEGKARKYYLVFSLISNVGTLFIFKYFNFFNANIEALAEFFHWNYSLESLSLILPLGLSFHIFQSLSYIIEVYKKNYSAEKNYLTYALYVLFFPQLVAGPIERPGNLLPQLKTEHVFDYARVISGLKQMTWGFFKKIVIGNKLAVLVDFVYLNIGTADSSTVLLAVFAFSFLLYADFSGYSDIAIGSARMLGIELMQNFNHPYFSRSTAELWRRWHISLSSWFRDYLYIPLGGNREGLIHQLRNIMIVFAIMGLWHGASWNFVVMGLLFGVYICVGHITKSWRDSFASLIGLGGKLKTVLQIIITFALTTFAWIFFRSESLNQAYSVLVGLFTRWNNTAFEFFTCKTYCAGYLLGISKTDLAIVALSVLIMIVYDYVEEVKVDPPKIWRNRSVRWSLYYAFILWMLFAGYFVPKTFIYFQF